MMRLIYTIAAYFLLLGSAFALCPTATLTFKDAAGTTQVLCFGGASGAFIPQHQILDSGGINALGINASGQITISNSAFTANAGTNLNTSALALDTSVNGILLGQASTTSGQKGPILQGAVTTAAPSYTTAQTDPLSLTTAGALRIDGSATTQPVLAQAVTANTNSGYSQQVADTPTVTAAAYASGNCVGGFRSITVAGNNAQSGLLTNFRVTSVSGVAAAMTVYLFEANPSASTCTDKGTFTLNSADVDKLIANPAPITLAAPLGATPSIAELTFVPPRPFLAGGSGSSVKTIYYALVMGGAFTPGSTTDFHTRTGVVLN